MRKIKVKEIRLLSHKREREIMIILNTGTVISAAPCYESYEQWGGSIEELQITGPIVSALNDWLHGSE